MSADSNMKAVLRAQFNPVKTMQQLVADRAIIRVFIVVGLLLAWCL